MIFFLHILNIQPNRIVGRILILIHDFYLSILQRIYVFLHLFNILPAGYCLGCTAG